MKKTKSKYSIRLTDEHTPHFVLFLTGVRDGKHKLVNLQGDEPQSDFITVKKASFSGYCASVLNLTFQEISKNAQAYHSATTNITELGQRLKALKGTTYSATTPADARIKIAAEQEMRELEQQLATLKEKAKDIESNIRIASHETAQLLVSKKAVLAQHLSIYLKGARVSDSALRAPGSFALPEAHLQDIKALEGVTIYNRALPELNLPNPDILNLNLPSSTST